MERMRHHAVRTCVGCGQRDEQRRMLRIAAREDGSLGLCVCGGRGAYVHGSRCCLSALDKSRLISRSLRRSLDREVRRALMVGLERRLGQEPSDE